MNEKTYEKITRPIYDHLHGVKILKTVNNIITRFVYSIYPIVLIILALNRDIRFWRVLLTPGISFVIVSVFRNYLNAPRPYEVLDIIPIINKDTKGKSFPSRHVFSIFIIAMAFYYISVPMGLVLMFLGIVLGVTRVLGGVHFPKDVIAGAIIGILCGIFGFFII
ncbi:MAG TPA: phosphatase PAP2 family protein [Tissierellales bacterium]|nr:phosphatase PAP2 family protein [Tissierellales bacterium]